YTILQYYPFPRFLFFFQAEDGIRYRNVTGVQTCALPISRTIPGALVPRHHPGAHELGQNFLRDRRTIARIVELAARRDGPIVEWGPGDGALTVPLSELGRPLEAIEIDQRAASELARPLRPPR